MEPTSFLKCYLPDRQRFKYNERKLKAKHGVCLCHSTQLHLAVGEAVNWSALAARVRALTALGLEVG